MMLICNCVQEKWIALCPWYLIVILFSLDSPPAATEGILIEELLSRHLLLRETFRRIPRL